MPISTTDNDGLDDIDDTNDIDNIDDTDAVESVATLCNVGRCGRDRCALRPEHAGFVPRMPRYQESWSVASVVFLDLLLRGELRSRDGHHRIRGGVPPDHRPSGDVRMDSREDRRAIE